MAIALTAAAPAGATSVEYVTRGTPTINVDVGSTEFIIDTAGDKAAIGSNDINGATLGSITKLTIDRLDDPTRFPAGSGPAVGPYLNIWITDEIGRAHV